MGQFISGSFIERATSTDFITNQEFCVTAVRMETFTGPYSGDHVMK
jgi:hypothetical protein